MMLILFLVYSFMISYLSISNAYSYSRILSTSKLLSKSYSLLPSSSSWNQPKSLISLRMSDDNPSDTDVSDTPESSSKSGVMDVSPISPSFAKDVLIAELSGDSLSRVEINEYVLALGK
jgi:hypothetical protein